MEENEHANLFADLVDDVDAIILPDGHVYMSIHTIDQMHAAIHRGAKVALDDGGMINSVMWHGAMWVMELYTQLHDALDMRGAGETVPDTAEELFDEE